MSTLKIEAGKHYRTSNGLRARVYATDGGDGSFVVHGAVFIPGRGWIQERWMDDGRSLLLNKESELNLIAEWLEPQVDWSALPKWARWVARDDNGDVYWYSEEPEIDDSMFRWMEKNEVQYGFSIVPDEYVLHREGDWRESLEQRPEASK